MDPSVHSMGSQAQPLEHDPVRGPDMVPDTHLFIAPHQPQPLMGVHVPQVV